MPSVLPRDITSCSNSTIDSRSSISEKQTVKSHSSSTKQIVESKELIQYRSGNIACFVITSGLPCDIGAKKLLEINKLPPVQNLNIGEINEIKFRNNKRVFSLCIKGDKDESLSLMKENIKNTLITLQIMVENLGLKEISIGKSDKIEQLPWTEIVNLLDLIFNK